MNFLLSVSAVVLRTLRLRSSAEGELLRRAGDGDREAIGLLFTRSRDKITSLAFQLLREREAAEDAAQEVLLRAFEKMPSFRGESEFSTWLYRLAINHCLEKRRVVERRRSLLETSFEPAGDVENHARRVETRLAIEAVLDGLSDDLRLVLILREWHELSYDEIAAILRLPTGTVRSRLHDARKKFRQLWEEQNGEV